MATDIQNRFKCRHYWLQKSIPSTNILCGGSMTIIRSQTAFLAAGGSFYAIINRWLTSGNFVILVTDYHVFNTREAI
jgi:hypothetical protein